MWRRRKPRGRLFYIRSRGTLHPPFMTMPGGDGVVELSEDGVRFSGGTNHYWGWNDLDSWSRQEDAVVLATTTGGGGYLIEVRPGEGMHRWLHLLPHHRLEDTTAGIPDR